MLHTKKHLKQISIL